MFQVDVSHYSARAYIQTKVLKELQSKAKAHPETMNKIDMQKKTLQKHPAECCEIAIQEASHTGWCPPVSWLTTPIKYSYIYHKPQNSATYFA